MGNETLYYNGTVLTMEEPLYAGALLVRDGRIAAVGSERELSALCPEAGRVDLKGRTLLPAFIDAHSLCEHPAFAAAAACLRFYGSGKAAERLLYAREASARRMGDWFWL